LLPSWLPNPRPCIRFFCVTFQLSLQWVLSIVNKKKKVWIFPSKTSFLLLWRVFLIWFDLVFIFLFDFVFIFIFTLYFPPITFLTLLLYYYLFLFTVFYLDFNKFGCPSKISMSPFLTSTKKLRNILKMLDYTHFEALCHISLLPLSSPRSSRSSCGREELPPIFHFHTPPKAF
jgi:hypothetical protein